MPDPITLALAATAAVGGAATWRVAQDEREAPDGPDGTQDQNLLGDPMINYSGNIELWRPYVVELALGASQPPEFHMAWIARESGGNPAAVGSLTARGPDGYAREIGLYQLYNPDELAIARVTSAQLRAGAAAPAGTQQLVRPLTDEEMRWQVQAGVNYIARRKRDTAAVLSAVGADWSVTDTWRMVKLFHALTGLPRAAALAARDQLGRAPSGWDELRDAARSIDLTRYGGANLARYAPYGDYTKSRGPLPNAEAVGGVVQS